MHALYVAVLVVLAACQLEAAYPRVPSDLLRPEYNKMLVGLRAASDARCHSRTTSCNDCNTVNTCAYIAGGYTFLKTSQCPDSLPYCDDGKCVKVSSADVCTASPPLATDFQCNGGVGYFPAPFDCTKFYVCTAGDKAYVYNCPSQHVYDHGRAGCVRLDENPASCFSFNCAQNAQQYVLYAPNPSVYAYCVDANTALVAKCPENSRMNPLNGNEPCKPYCSREGRIADGDNVHGYYECFVNADNTLSAPVLQFCPPNMAFNPANLRCEDEAASPTPAPAP
ncbi:uncharacterized protein LOC117647305 [Thrips palmi]|uniref:Uncharacterized protein LOC117647305 n=1 Tax=Thrips palmi TaxID=161013 RepID=A0A6P8Z523_THRPL|nr:uncharacterized protein LOC117647305 [Thrips palmi]